MNQEQEQIRANKSELWSISLRDLFYKYVRFLPVFILSVAVALFGSYAYLRYATPIYSTTGTLFIKAEPSGARGDKIDDLFGNDKAQNIQSEIVILKSRPLMTRVVEKLNLQYSFFAKGKIKTLNIYKASPFTFVSSSIVDSLKPFALKMHIVNENSFVINDEEKSIPFGHFFKNQFGTFQITKKPGYTLGGDYAIYYSPSGSVGGSYASSVAVTPKSLAAGILDITIQTESPQLGADIVNQLMEEYRAYTKELKNQTSDQIINFVNERLDILGNELDSLQTVLLNYASTNNIVDIQAQSTDYFESMKVFDEQVRLQNRQVGVADIIIDYLGNKQNEFNKVVVPSSLGLEDATLEELVSGYNQLQLERQRLLEANVPVNNPAVTAAESQIEVTRKSLLENLRNIRASISGNVSALRNNSVEVQSQLKALPYKVQGYYEIKRQVDNKQTLFNLLQEKREETAISRASNIPTSQIVEKAVPNRTPVKPNRRAIQIMAILLGIALPGLIIFAGEVLNDKVSNRFDVEKITSAPILGEVGHSYSESVLIVNKTTRSMVAEQFRIIRSNLQYVINKSEKPTILVTSSFSGEGKSYISTNMGAVLALTGKRTIILEFDIRKPKVLSGLGIAKRAGLTNFLVGKNENLAELIFPVPDHENLFVLACGPIPPNPSELLLEPKVDELFAWLKSNFDAVIVDTAPVGMVSDAMTLGKYCDSTLYLVRQGHTFKKQVTLIDEFYQDNKLPRVSIIINDVKMKPGYGYYGYGRYGYGYGYGYGSYYEEEQAPKNFLERMLSALDVRRLFKKKRRK